jgi:hypothetical protein
MPSTSKRAAAAPAGGKKKGRNGGARTTTATNGRRAAPRQAKKTAPTAAELAAAVRKRGAGAAGACAPGEDDNGDAEQPATSTRNKDDFDIQPDNVIFSALRVASLPTALYALEKQADNLRCSSAPCLPLTPTRHGQESQIRNGSGRAGLGRAVPGRRGL